MPLYKHKGSNYMSDIIYDEMTKGYYNKMFSYTKKYIHDI